MIASGRGSDTAPGLPPIRGWNPTWIAGDRPRARSAEGGGLTFTLNHHDPALDDGT
jgi:hypothetical protein